MRRNFCEINDSVAWKNGMRGVFITEGNGWRVRDRGKKFSSLLRSHLLALLICLLELFLSCPLKIPSNQHHRRATTDAIPHTHKRSNLTKRREILSSFHCHFYHHPKHMTSKITLARLFRNRIYRSQKWVVWNLMTFFHPFSLSSLSLVWPLSDK